MRRIHTYKPIIGIVSGMEYIDKGIYQKTVYCVNEDYINVICRFDAIPVLIPYSNDFKNMETFLKQLDGLLLIGGEDISSTCFNNKPSENKRDDFEIKIYNFFKKLNRPILGICRGLQLINVAEGGTLKNIVDTKISHFIEKDGWINYHNMNIVKQSKLYTIINESQYTISSLHHQQIDKLGNNLIVSATADDGIPEVIESNNSIFIMGFQGHIEKCFNNFKKYENIFKNFVEEAKNGKK